MNATTTPFTRSRGIANESTVDSPEANLANSSMIIITLMFYSYFSSFPLSFSYTLLFLMYDSVAL